MSDFTELENEDWIGSFGFDVANLTEWMSAALK